MAGFSVALCKQASRFLFGKRAATHLEVKLLIFIQS